MTTQQQEQRSDQQDKRTKRRKRLSRRSLVIITVLLLAIAIIIAWILSYLNVIPRFWASIFTIIITVFGAVFTFFQSMHLFLPAEQHESSETSLHSSAITYISTTLTNATTTSEKSPYRGIVGLLPPTDPRTIQQREQLIEDVYARLIQSGITALALTGIGGVGKSTLAALLYRYAEEQRYTHNKPFLAETLWFTVDPAVTFADLAGNLFEALGKPLPDLSNLAPQNQAIALFNALNATDRPRLIILDQFENLLDWDTGHALTDRPGVGEWLDIINSQQCTCRILLTSRPRPVGTREYPPTHLQEYPVGGLEVNEGITLLQSQGVQGTPIELQTAVIKCAGHALSLTFLAALMRNHHLDLSTLFANAGLWSGDIASHLLDQIFTQKINYAQRYLLLAFSVYREPVPVEAASAIISASKTQILPALKALVTQHLVEAVGAGHYQLHAIIADYAQLHFDESAELANKEARKATHIRAAQYYQQRAVTSCPAHDRRRNVGDVHDLAEAIWHYCQAEQWQVAYNLIEQERIFSSLRRWGSNAILLELCLLLQPWGSLSPEPSQLAFIHLFLGWVYNALGKRKLAIENNEKALQLYIESEDFEGQENILASLGWSYFALGQMTQAKEYYERALGISKKEGYRLNEGHDLNGLGRVYVVQGQRELALEYFEQALQICKEQRNAQLEGRTLSNLGLVHTELGNYMKALGYLDQSLDIRKKTGDRRGVGATLENIGRVYIELGEPEKAVKCFEEELIICQTIGDRGLEGWALNNLGWAYNALERYEEAKKVLEQALHIRQEVGDRRGECRTMRNLGQSMSMLGQKRQALEYYKQAHIISQETQDSYGEGTILQNFAMIYFDQARFDIALSCFLIAKRIFEEIHSPYHKDTQKWIDIIHKKIGEERFMALLTKVELQAQQIVDQALDDLQSCD